MKLKYLLFSLFLFPVFVVGQAVHLEGLRIENQKYIQEGESISIAFDLVMDDFPVKTEQMIYVTPRLKATAGNEDLELTPLLVVGNRRNKVLERIRHLKGELVLDPMPQQIVKRTNGHVQRVSYRENLPYYPWMRKSSLTLLLSVTGCASCDEGMEELPVAENFIKDIFIPQLNYLSPVVQPSKRKAGFSGVINFKVDKADILVDYKNNFVPIKRADDLVNEVKSIAGAHISGITISGYASPEASMAHNKSLSERRANAFADYIAAKHDLPRSGMVVVGHGEDWEMLKQQVTSSSLKNKQDILAIINNTGNPDERDAPLKKLDGERTYRTLLNDYYPLIRRIEMNIDYEVMEDFDLEVVLKKYRENPSEMSLNEYYFLSQQYQAGSEQFNALFAKAANYYTDDLMVNLNVAVGDIEKGNYQAAVDRMMHFEKESKALNVLGVAYARLEQYEDAKAYFAKAVAEGDAQAQHNLDGLMNYLGE